MEAEFRPSGSVSIWTWSRLQHHINSELALSALCGPTAPSVLGLGITHLDLDTSQQMKNKLTGLCFCDSTIIRIQPPFSLSRAMNDNTPDSCWSSSFALLSCKSTSLYRKHTVCRVQWQLSSTENQVKAGNITKVEDVEWISPAAATGSRQ